MPDKSAIEVITEVLREHRPSIASEVGPEPYWCGDDETDGCGSWNRTTPVAPPGEQLPPHADLPTLRAGVRDRHHPRAVWGVPESAGGQG